MKRKVIALMLCMTTLLTVAGCGDKKGSTDATEEVLTDTESTETGYYTGKRSGESGFSKYFTLIGKGVNFFVASNSTASRKLIFLTLQR